MGKNAESDNGWTVVFTGSYAPVEKSGQRVGGEPSHFTPVHSSPQLFLCVPARLRQRHSEGVGRASVVGLRLLDARHQFLQVGNPFGIGARGV